MFALSGEADGGCATSAQGKGGGMIYYLIEVNVARRGCPPVWHDLVDENNECVTWETEAAVRDALKEEGRGGDARIMRFVNGIGKAIA